MKNFMGRGQNFALMLLVLAVCGCVQLTTANAQTASGAAQTETVKTAREMIDKNQTAAAIALLDRIIKVEPDNAEAYAERARAYFIAKKNDEAMTDAEKAISLDQKNPVALNIRGLVKRSRKDYDAALADFNAAIAADPNFIKAIYNRADIYAIQKKFDPAIEDLNQVVRLQPESLNPYVLRAKIYEVQGKNELAIADYTQSIRLKPNDLFLLGGRGNIYLNQNQIELAIADYRQALTIDPQNASIKYDLSLALARRKYLKPGAKIDEAAAVAAYNAGKQAYDERKDYEAAIKFYTECIALNPILDVCYTNRADASRKLEKYDAAIADYNIAAELAPIVAKNYSNRGLTYFRQKNYDAAIKDYNRAIELDPKDSLNYVNRGASLANLGKLVEGEADVKKALQLNPNDQAGKIAYDQIEALLHPPGQRIIDGGASTETADVAPVRVTMTALEYEKQGVAQNDNKDYQAAIVSYSNCLKIEPQNYECYYNRGAAYSNMGKLDEALADINKTLAIKPDLQIALDGKSVILGLIEKQKATNATYKEFGVYSDEFGRLGALHNEKDEVIFDVYKNYTGAVFDQNNLRPLNAEQKTTVCSLVGPNRQLEDAMKQELVKMQKMRDEGKLDQYPNLKAVVKLSTDLYTEDLNFSAGFNRAFGCGLPE